MHARWYMWDWNCDGRGLMYSAWPIRVGWVAGSGWMPIWLTNADQLRSRHTLSLAVNQTNPKVPLSHAGPLWKACSGFGRWDPDAARYLGICETEVLGLSREKSFLPLLAYLRPHKMIATLHTACWNTFSWLKYIYCFRLKFHKHCFLEVSIPSIGSGNGSASIRRKAIIWANDGLGPVSLKLFLTEVKLDENVICSHLNSKRMIVTIFLLDTPVVLL